MQEQVKIRRINEEDANALVDISRQTFQETFADANTAEDMNKYLEEKFSFEILSAELNDNHSFFWLAEYNGMTIGYLKLNTGNAQTELKEQDAVEIERIYVQRQFHGFRVGQLLLDKSIAFAKKQHATFIWLGVWEHNQRAIHFYEKNGFVAFDKHLFVLGNDEQTDIMMKLNL